MTITRLRTAGAETGNLNEIDGTASYGGSTFDARQTRVKSGNYAYYSSSGSILWKYGYINFTPSGNRFRIGLWMNLDQVSSYGAAPIVKVMAGGTELCYLGFSNTTAALVVLGTTRGTANSYLDVWEHWGIEVKTDPTNGWVKIYRNGINEMGWEGNTGSTNGSQIRMGKYSNNFSQSVYYDDIYIDDMAGEDLQVPPILYFRPIFPNGVGDYSQWTPTSGSNWETVDEQPTNESDYVQSEALGDIDSYQMTTQTLDTDEFCRAILPVVWAKRGGSTEKLKFGTRLASVNQFSSEITPGGGAYAYFIERFPLNPSGAEWSQADIDALQFIMESAGTY